MRETSSGGNVFDHLSGVILKILSENPEDAVAQFENMSLAVKKTAFAQASADGGSGAGISDEAKAAQIAAANSTLSKLKVGEDGATDAPQVQDLLGDSALLEWAGVSIGQGAWFQLAAYMKNLVKEQAEAEDDPLEIKKIRFWGKVLGCKGIDYYVYECQAPGREIEIPEGVRMEGSDGPNRLTYFVVCSDDMGRARRLPDVTEAQIITARQIKKYMTGDLTAPVAAYPPFPGTEANFLRAQIA